MKPPNKRAFKHQLWAYLDSGGIPGGSSPGGKPYDVYLNAAEPMVFLPSDNQVGFPVANVVNNGGKTSNSAAGNALWQLNRPQDASGSASDQVLSLPIVLNTLAEFNTFS